MELILNYLYKLFKLIKIIYVIIYSYILVTIYNESQDSILSTTMDSLIKINPLFIKYLQALAGQTDLRIPGLEAKLIMYTNNVPYTDKDIDNSFRINLESNNIRVEKTPINSGLLGLVYKGYDTNNNRNIIVKVKRNNIDKVIKNALDELYFILTILNKISYLSALNLIKNFEEKKVLITQQLDYSNEVENIKLFATKYKNMVDIVIPDVYEEYTKRNINIIVMEYIKGNTLAEVDINDKQKYCEIIAKYGIKAIFYDGIYHADFHPGNVLFQKNGDDYKLVLLDFGIIGQLSRENQNHLYEFFVSMFKKKL